MSNDKPIFPLASMRRERKDNRREKFCELLADGVKPEEAGALVGYAEGSGRTLAYRREVREKVRELCAAKLAASVPLAIKKLTELLGSDLDSVALGSIREILGRGGLPEQAELSVERKFDRQQAEETLREYARRDPRVRRLLEEGAAQAESDGGKIDENQT